MRRKIKRKKELKKKKDKQKKRARERERKSCRGKRAVRKEIKWFTFENRTKEAKARKS